MSGPTTPTAPATWREALDTAVQLAPGRVPEEDVDRLVTLRDHVEERLGLGDAVTVAALAGGTGVGKSALVNRLAGTEVVVEGVRRPTTGSPVAVAATIDQPTRRLLDWLGIDDRRQVPGVLPDGLVLVDLPDHDSVQVSHRRTSERLAARVDVLVVVVDAIKYARADLHEGALASLTAHAEVLTVVLNRSDELQDHALAEVRGDLTRRLAADGLAAASVLTTSAATGAGVDELRDLLTSASVARTAAARRLAADAAVVAEDVLDRLPELPSLAPEVPPLVEVALEAADAHRTIGLALLEQHRAGRHAVRSPPARALATLVGLGRRLGRGFGFARGTAAADLETASQRSEARLSARLAESLDLAARAGPAHTVLEGAIGRAAAQAAPAVVAEVRRAAHEVAGTRRRWWPVAAAARGLAEGTALAGLVWQVLLGVVVWLGLPALPRPMVTAELTWPAALLLAGLGVRVLLGGLSRLALSVSSRRLRRSARRRLDTALTEVVASDLLAPYDAEAAAITRLRGALLALG